MIGDKLRGFMADSAPSLCNAALEDAPLIYWCDRPKGHGGDRHEERYVASWKADDTDLRHYAGERDGLPVYRPVFGYDYLPVVA